MPRLRGVRRACLLIASALPLLADVPETSTTGGGSHSTQTAAEEQRVPPYGEGTRQNTSLLSTITPTSINDESSANMENNLATPSDWAQSWEYGHHHNVVVAPPFRPHTPITTDPTTDVVTNHETVESPDSESTAESSTSDDNEEEAEDEAVRTHPFQVRDEADDTLAEQTETDRGNEVIESVSVDRTAEGDNDTSDTTESVDAAGSGDSRVSETETDVVDQTELEDSPEAEAAEVSHPVENDYEDETVKSVKFDFASKSAGALILEKSAGWKGASNLLNSDSDRYALIPCAESSKAVVVSLSEDVYVKTVVLTNYERFSSTIRDFQLLGSQTMGTWVNLGTYTAKPGGGKQEFELKVYSWARYMKLRVLSHHGNEHYLTISQLSVFGDTMLQGFHEQWEEEQVQDDAEAVEKAADDSGIEGIDSSPPGSSGEERKERNTANHLDISEFSANDPCIPTPGSICPKDLSFEQIVFLYSTNQSHADRMSFLSSSTSCRSLRKYEHDRFPEIHVQSRSPVSAIALETRDRRSESLILSDDQSFQLDRVQLPVIGHIENLIKSTSGVDLGLSTVSLFQKKASTSEEEIRQSDSDLKNVEQDSSTVLDQESISNSVETDPALKEAYSNSYLQESPGALRDESFNDLELDSLIKYLQRLPSSSCLKDIDFAEYRKRVASSKFGNTGPNNGQSTGGGGELQPIFKKLTDEIKALQNTLGVQEGYVKSAVSCYQKILLELIIHQQEAQLQTEKRMNDLEHAINTYMTWLRFVEDCISSVRSFVNSVLHTWSSWVLKLPPNTLEMFIVLCTVIFTLSAGRFLYFASWGWLSARRQREEPSKSNREPDSTKVESEGPISAKDCLANGKTEYSSMSMHRGKEGEKRARLMSPRDSAKTSTKTSEVSSVHVTKVLPSETKTSHTKNPLR